MYITRISLFCFNQLSYANQRAIVLDEFKYVRGELRKKFILDECDAAKTSIGRIRVRFQS